MGNGTRVNQGLRYAADLVMCCFLFFPEEHYFKVLKVLGGPALYSTVFLLLLFSVLMSIE